MNVTRIGKPGQVYGRFAVGKGGGSCGGPAFLTHQDHSARFIQPATWKYDPRKVNVLVKGNTNGQKN